MHLNTDPGERDFTASAILLRKVETGRPEVLLHMHRSLGRLLQPGGHIERSESVAAALIREVEEETGYHVSQLTILQPPRRLKQLTGNRVQPMPISIAEHAIGDGDHFHIDLTFAVIAADGERLGRVGNDESHDVRWLSADRAINAAHGGVGELIRFALDVCLTHWERVPLGDFVRQHVLPLEIDQAHDRKL